MHSVPAQNVPMAQPESSAQVVGHEGLVPSQTYGEHEGEPEWPAAAGVHVPGLASQRSHFPAQVPSQQ